MKLIKTKDKFILVNNEEWVKGDWYYTNLGNIYQDTGKFLPEDNEEDKAQFTSTVFKRKIIAGIPSLPVVELSLLKEEDCKTIGWVDKFKIADSATKDLVLTSEGRTQRWWGVLQGLDIAQSLNKEFSLEDMREAFYQGGNSREDDLNGDGETPFEEFIQSLQKTEWNVEVDKVPYVTNHNFVNDSKTHLLDVKYKYKVTKIL